MGKSSPKFGKKQVELSNNKNNNDDDKSNGKRKRVSSSTSTCTNMSDDEQQQQQQRYPLSDVVSDCTKRWFQETLKEARNGDVNMQIILSQMYYNGYGIPNKDPKKGKTWITRASRVRSSVWKISRKRPGYHASDSDSDDIADS